MADWKLYMSRDFAGCQLMAYARDNCRQRDVRIFKIPGEVESVGVSDGIDRWIAPVIADPFSVNIKRLMEDLCAGKPLPHPTPPGEAKPRRRAVLGLSGDNPPSRTRKPLLTHPTQPQATRTRRALSA